MRSSDLRDYVKVGDVLTYESTKAAYTVEDLSKKSIRAKGVVTAVYPYFAITKLRKCQDTANRWDIYEINGRPFKAFGGGDQQYVDML